MTRPCLRMILHLLQIFFTLGLTFIGWSLSCYGVMCSCRALPAAAGRAVGELLVPVDDPPATEVVRAQLDDDPVIGQDPNVVHPHLATDVG